jgi:hypothetical protein
MSVADVNASLLEGYTSAFAAALGIPTGRIDVSVAGAEGPNRRLLGTGPGVILLVVVQVADYTQAVAVMGFAMTQPALYAATRALQLPDLEFIPDSVVYTPGEGTPGAPGPEATDAADRWEQSHGRRRRPSAWTTLILLLGAALCH